MQPERAEAVMSASEAGTNPRSPFRTPRDEREYQAAYEASLRRWPVPYEELDLDGPFGRTHVLVSGVPETRPLVLLHGYGASSTMWALNIRELASRYRVFAVDVMGQAGKSLPRAPLATRSECAEWLTSVLDGLGLDEVRLAGVSYGGWLTLNYALAVPERLRAIGLISPGGLLPLSSQMRIRGMLATLVPLQICSDVVLMRWIRAKHAIDDAEQRALSKLMARQMYLGLHVRNELVRLGAPAIPFSDNELRSLRVPTLLLIGEEEVLYDPVAALSRARRLIPGLVGDLIPGASHDLAFRQPKIVDERLLAFLATVEERRPTPIGGESAAQHV